MSPLAITARSGYAARGVVYAIVGGFAVQAAVVGGETRGADEAAPVLLGQPFGRVLVGLLALGLLAYAVWRLVQAVRDTDDHGSGPKGLAIRAAKAGSGLAYLGLALSAAALLASLGLEDRSDRSALMANAIGFVGARWTAAILAALFLAIAAGQAVRAIRGTFMRYFSGSAERRRLVRILGRIGILARAGGFLILAWLMGWRALNAGTDAQSPGMEQVLKAVEAMPGSTVLLFAMGIGFIAFALFSFAAARWRMVDARPPVRGSGYGELRRASLSPLAPERSARVR